MVPQALPDRKVQQVQMAHKVRRELQDRPDRKGLRESQDQQVRKACKVSKE